MKKIFLLLTLLPSLSYSQIPQFEISNIYYVEPVVVETNNKTASDIYKMSKEWLNLIYTNPSKVIKGSVENDFIRFQGMKSGFAFIEIMGTNFSYNLKYTLRIDVKNDKYRLTLENYEIISPATQHGQSGSTLELYKQKTYQDGNGNIKQKYLKYYDSYSVGLLNEINEINKSLYDYLTGKTKEAKDDW